MQTMDQALLAAIQAREVDPEDAFTYAVDKRPFTRFVPDGTAILRPTSRRGSQDDTEGSEIAAARPSSTCRGASTGSSGRCSSAAAPTCISCRRPTPHPHLRRAAHAARRADHPGAGPRGAHRDHDAPGARAPRGEGRRRLRLHDPRRVALPRQRVPAHRRPGGVFRAIPSKALTLDELNMPESVRSLCHVNNGLILVTGKTGSGKSTTLRRP